MAGKIAGTVFTLFVLTFLVAIIIFYFVHTSIRAEINDINYSVTETVATTGELNEDLYNYLRDSVNRYGDYYIKLKLEQQIAAGDYDVYFDDTYILGRKLKIGDRLTIYLEDRNPALFGRLINATIMGWQPDNEIDTNIKSIKTAIISKNAK
ncbi:MAG: hypothetical protein N3B21_05130 [Clostridia bacterium]|nr:hypothetical protein [Clostridia bacterium]